MYNGPEYLTQNLRISKSYEYDDELTCLFNKKVKFQSTSDWKLPDTSSWFNVSPWKVRELDCLKSKLNFHKSQLNDFNIEEWSNHTRRRNPAGEVCWKMKCCIDPEFLTQAWTKFYECAFTYDIVPPEVGTDKKMVSLHLCEAPGAFITSLNHYLKTYYLDVEWKWLANTLNPYYEGNSLSNMINDDRFMFHTLENWHFGVDSTGNLMNWENSQAIIEKATSMGKVQLVTADGSIDCMQRPDAQEEVTSPLHYCEIITALQVLCKGGTLLYKLFTMFEHSTVSLLYLVCNLFKEVHIFKPATSRQGNSEVYAICLQYKGNELLKEHIPTLQSAFGTEVYSNKALFNLKDIPQSFLLQVIDCARYFCDLQCQVINNNIQAYFMPRVVSLHKDMKRIRATVATQFIQYYDIRPLKHEYEIMKGLLHEDHKVNNNSRYHRGSYTERQMYSTMTLIDKCLCLKSSLQEGPLLNQWLHISNDKWLDSFQRTVVNIVFTYGLPLKQVNSSTFIYVPIFKLYHQILDVEEFKQIIISSLTKGESDLKNVYDSTAKILQLPEYNHLKDYNIFEKSCFNLLLECLHSLEVNDTLTVENYSAITHFNVSVLYILCTQCFKNTCFTTDGKIMFCKMIDKSAIKYLELINDECNKRKIENVDVLNFLSVKLTNIGDFFNNVILYNNTFFVKKCKDYFALIEKNISSLTVPLAT